MTLTRKKITVTFLLGKGRFGEEGYNTITIPDLRVHCHISNAGGPQLGTVQANVFGLTKSHMNQLGNIIRMPNGKIEIVFNQLIIEAGDELSGMSRIFQGQIYLCPIDLSSGPDSILSISATAGAFEAVKSVQPASYPGSADAAIIMQNIATKMNIGFENNGVSVILATPYYPGTLLEQMKQCREEANIEAVIDNGKLIIWPKYGSRGGSIPVVSPSTGMVGYPTNWDTGVFIKTIFNPQLSIGRRTKVESSLPFANGTYIISDIAHDLESEQPGGDWFSTFHGSPFNANP